MEKLRENLRTKSTRECVLNICTEHSQEKWHKGVPGRLLEGIFERERKEKMKRQLSLLVTESSNSSFKITRAEEIPDNFLMLRRRSDDLPGTQNGMTVQVPLLHWEMVVLDTADSYCGLQMASIVAPCGSLDPAAAESIRPFSIRGTTQGARHEGNGFDHLPLSVQMVELDIPTKVVSSKHRKVMRLPRLVFVPSRYPLGKFPGDPQSICLQIGFKFPPDEGSNPIHCLFWSQRLTSGPFNLNP